MKLRIFRTSGEKVEGPMITVESRKVKKPFPFEGEEEIDLYYCDVPDLEHLLKLPVIFWDKKYNRPGNLIITICPWTGEQAIELYDDWRE